MNKLAVSIVALLGVGAAHAAVTPHPTASDARIRKITYEPNNVYKIIVQKGTVTRILLAEDEKILERGAASGFPANCEEKENAWCITADAGSNQIWVKPKDGATHNNLELRTSKRDYSFDFKLIKNPTKVSRGKSLSEQPMFRVVFEYPQDAIEKTQREKALQYAQYQADLNEQHQLSEFLVLQHRLANDAPIPKNWNYRQASNSRGKSFVPEMVFDDGRFTYLRFKGNTDIPTIFAEGADGEEKVNFHVNKEDPKLVIVEALAKKLVLRQGKAVVSVFNESYDPVGVAPQDGTTVEGVKRVVVGDMK
ncbi:TrbG/VirB9 family P-type conjugative transfer protein [Acinetobacter baumannii]|nr:TrbG/VirB9 family P-type conjugative transfer protein [Acinetobacter baumannii]